MTYSLKFAVKLLTIFWLNGLQPPKVEGVEWVHGFLKGFITEHKTQQLLDKLYVVPSEDSSRQNETMDLINKISLHIDTIGTEISQRNTIYLESAINLKNLTEIQFGIKRLRKNIIDIKSRYSSMKSMSQNIETYENTTKRRFAEWNVNPGVNSISHILSDIFSIYFEPGCAEFSLADKIAFMFYEAKVKNCNYTFSVQQHFFDDYMELTIIGIQAYLINKFSWAILSHSMEKNFKDQETFCHEHEVRTLLMTKKLRELIAKTETEIRTCDPDQWKEKVNYEQLTRLIQGYIVNEASLNEDHSCSKECTYYKKVKVNCFHKDPYCLEDRGTGQILRCDPESKASMIDIYPSNNPARRYYFLIQYGYYQSHFWGSTNGEKQPNNKRTVESWYRGIYKCNYCFCYMDEKSNKSDRFFNLQQVLSDEERNRVVTGVRFVKKNRIMYLQIQQGHLGPFGSIEKNSTEWKEIETFAMTKHNEGTDYVTLDNDLKSINLDEVYAKNPSSVVTGVKFSVERSHIYLRIRVTSFNFETGKLIQSTNSSEWISNFWSHNKRVPLSKDKDGPNVSTRAPRKSVPSSHIYNVVHFTHSSKKNDASQTTLPFIDSQDVVSQPPLPLSGVGLYHRGYDGYGGFLAPKIFTLDLLNFI